MGNEGSKQKVSIVVCTYNGERYISTQLDSIIAQTYPIDEIVIQDDNSTDGTWTILERYAAKHQNIHIFHNEAEHGVNGNFFSAIRHTSGDFIALSDQDDIWHTDKIEKQMKRIGTKLLCSCKTRPFSDDGAFAYYDERTPNYHLQRLVFSGLPGHTMLFRRELFTEIMPKDNEIYHVSFYDVAFELAAGAFDSIAYVDEVLVDFRRHKDATTYAGNRHSNASARNAVRMLWWCLTNWRRVRPVARRLWHARLTLLKAIDADTDSYHDTVRMLELEMQNGIIPMLKLQKLFMNDYKILFQTVGGGTIKKIRAFLFPLLQYYYYK